MSRHGKKSRKHPARQSQSDDNRGRPPTRDSTIYLGLTFIGLAVVLGAFLLWEGNREGWGAIAVGYVAAMAFLAHRYAMRIVKGDTLANWQRALAKLPLGAAGFGIEGKRPLEAAAGQASARRAILIGAIVSIVLVIGLALVLIPGIL